ncbi:hypothetical protein SAMN02910298_01918 [Pseudobutyrivibrio sp. YE44]|uniref:hypothetical protein n=1 Tax=Pseudobutyrivibrio sp. YE44 TaxID=1520802 RepID=UPI00088631D8|nr:hypothetical protein [Pseudobutyrivibrio sp. YE44]SDB38918.1 hypothetical protein SAMN02910298_01918 [Pseudobutyrivibrio sp. YE44]
MFDNNSSAKLNKILSSKYYKALDWASFAVALIGSCAAMYYLFSRQVHTDGETYMSDILPYISEMMGRETQFDFPYPVLFKTGHLIAVLIYNPEIAMAITVMLFQALGMIITKVVLNKQTGARLLSTFCTLGLFFDSMIFSDFFKQFGIRYHYEGVMSSNPWHNATYMAARPFMILAFVLGAATLVRYEKELVKKVNTEPYHVIEDGKIDLVEAPAALKRFLSEYGLYVGFTASLLLATMSKPSYTIIHMAAAGIIMVWRFVACHFKNFRQTLLMGVCYIPTIIALLYQYSGVFTGQGADSVERGIGFGIGRVWGQYTTNIPLALLLGAAFPFVALLFHLKDLKTDAQYRFGWQVYLAATVMALVLYEKGFREWHFNFGWGYICGLFIVFMISAVVVLRDTLALFGLKTCQESPTIQTNKILFALKLILQWSVFGVHILMGLRYFQLLCWGANYM